MSMLDFWIKDSSICQISDQRLNFLSILITVQEPDSDPRFDLNTAISMVEHCKDSLLGLVHNHENTLCEGDMMLIL